VRFEGGDWPGPGLTMIGLKRRAQGPDREVTWPS